MDTLDEIILIGIIAIIIIFTRDIRELIIPIKKRKIEIIGLVIGILAIIWIAYRYASSTYHYILGILGIIAYILSVFRIGISSRGFKPNQRGPITWKWDKITSVNLIIKEDLRIEIYRKDSSDIQIYKKEDYERIMEVLTKNLPKDAIKINGR